MKTFAEIIDSVISQIKATIGRVDTRIGTVLRDAIITPIVSAISDLWAFVSNISKDQSVSTYTSSAALDRIAANFGIVRSSGTFATGSVRFYVMRRPSRDIEIPYGTRVYGTAGAPDIVFTTLATAYIYNISSPTFNIEGDKNSPFYGYYYVEVGAICTTAGTSGNLSAGTLTATDLQVIEGVDNPLDMSNGTDALTDQQLASLVTTTARGNIGTVSGYKSLVDGSFSFKDTAVIPFNDPESVRTGSGASIDIILLTNAAASVIESFPYAALITPAYQPLQSVTSIVLHQVSPAAVIDLVAGVDYVVNYDTTSAYAGSQRARSTISILGSHGAGDTLDINYKYNPDPTTVQSFCDLPENKVLGSDVMVKAATRVLIGVKMDIVALPGYSMKTVTESARAKIVELIDGFLLGEDIQKTDIVDKVYEVAGVDYINSGTFEMREKVGATWQPDSEEITALKREVIALSKTDGGAYDIYINEVAPWP